MNGTRIWMHRGERKRIGETCWCDMVSNAFLARRDTIARVRWDDEIKTYEHWEFSIGRPRSNICKLPWHSIAR